MGYSSTGEKADRAINRHSADSRQSMRRSGDEGFVRSARGSETVTLT